MTIARRAISNVSWVFFLSILAAGVGYLVRVLIARNLSVEEYGLLYAIFSMFTLFAVFGDLGLTSAIQKIVPEYLVRKRPDIVKGIALVVLGIQLAVFGAFSAAAILFSKQLANHYFRVPTAVLPIIILAAAFWLRPVSQTLGSLFIGFQNIRFYGLIDPLKIVLVLVFASALFWLIGATVAAAGLAYLLSFALVPVILTPALLRTFPKMWATPTVMNKALLGGLFRFALPSMVGLVGSSILVYTDTMMLTYFRDLQEVGFYQVAYPTANLLFYLPGAIVSIILPLSSELWARGERAKLQQGCALLDKYTMILMLPLCLLAAVFAEEILSILFGETYLQAMIPLAILAGGAVLYAFGSIYATVLSGIGKPKAIAKIVLIAAAVNVGLNLFIIPFYGMVGAAITTVIGYIIILVLTSRHIRQSIGSTAPIGLWGKNVIAGIFLILVTLGLKRLMAFGAIAKFLIIVPLGLIVYVVALVLLRALTLDDVRLLCGALRQQSLTEDAHVR